MRSSRKASESAKASSTSERFERPGCSGCRSRAPISAAAKCMATISRRLKGTRVGSFMGPLGLDFRPWQS